MMGWVFLSPAFLWLLVVVPLVGWWPRRRLGVKLRFLRMLTLSCVIFSLARPVSIEPSEKAYHALIVDDSASVAPELSKIAESAALNVVEGLPKDDGTAMIVFDDSDHSPIGACLADALRAIPRDSRGAITLFSDGRGTGSDWGDALEECLERKIPVHTVSLEKDDSDVFPSGIQMVDRLREGHEGRVDVRVAGDDAKVTVRLIDERSQELLAVAEDVLLEEGALVPLLFEPKRAGFLAVVVRVEIVNGDDSNLANNEFRAVLPVQDPYRVRYVGERQEGGSDRLASLLGAGVVVEASDSDDFSAIDGIWLDDQPAASLSEAWQAAAVNAVMDQGLGLMMSGGLASFGPGGYEDTPLAAILPVAFQQKEEKRDPSTTLVVIIDTSGSMSGERVQLAKEVARLAIRRLLPHDKVGIVEFYGTKQWAAPIQSAANAIDIQRALNRMDAGGGTVIMPAIEEAYYALQNVQTRYKHVLVLTDGGVEAGQFEPLLRKMAAKGMNVSTVLVGGETHSEFLVNIANWGKGHFYSASNRFSIPEILLKQPSTSTIPAYRPGDHAVTPRGGYGWWGPVDPQAAPPLKGYVETRLRPGAEVLLETTANHHPILASWRFGLGRVTTFLTEPVGAGTAAWKAWPDYGPALARVLARTVAPGLQPFAFEVSRFNDHIRVEAKRLVTTEERPFLRRVDGEEPQAWRFDERAPGRFVASEFVEANSEVFFEAGSEALPGKAPIRLVGPISLPETQVDPAEALSLSELSHLTGGRVVQLADAPNFAPPLGGGDVSLVLASWWPWLALLGVVSYLAELLFRRLPKTAKEGRVSES